MGNKESVVKLKKSSPNESYGFVLSTRSDLTHIVRDIRPGSLADKNGLEDGDIVLKINGTIIHQSLNNQEALFLIKRNPNSVELTISKDKPEKSSEKLAKSSQGFTNSRTSSITSKTSLKTSNLDDPKPKMPPETIVDEYTPFQKPKKSSCSPHQTCQDDLEDTDTDISEGCTPNRASYPPSAMYGTRRNSSNTPKNDHNSGNNIFGWFLNDTPSTSGVQNINKMSSEVLGEPKNRSTLKSRLDRPQEIENGPGNGLIGWLFPSKNQENGQNLSQNLRNHDKMTSENTSRGSKIPLEPKVAIQKPQKSRDSLFYPKDSWSSPMFAYGDGRKSTYSTPEAPSMLYGSCSRPMDLSEASSDECEDCRSHASSSYESIPKNETSKDQESFWHRLWGSKAQDQSTEALRSQEDCSYSKNSLKNHDKSHKTQKVGWRSPYASNDTLYFSADDEEETINFEIKTHENQDKSKAKPPIVNQTTGFGCAPCKNRVYEENETEDDEEMTDVLPPFSSSRRRFQAPSRSFYENGSHARPESQNGDDYYSNVGPESILKPSLTSPLQRGYSMRVQNLNMAASSRRYASMRMKEYQRPKIFTEHRRQILAQIEATKIECEHEKKMSYMLAYPPAYSSRSTTPAPSNRVLFTCDLLGPEPMSKNLRYVKLLFDATMQGCVRQKKKILEKLEFLLLIKLQTEATKASICMIYNLNSIVQTNNAIAYIKIILENILWKPKKKKLRRIKKSDRKFKDLLCNTKGAIEFLKSIGFRDEYHAGENESFLSLSSTEDDVLRNLETSLGLLLSDNFYIPIKLYRNPKVYKIRPNASLPPVNIPHEFYKDAKVRKISQNVSDVDSALGSSRSSNSGSISTIDSVYFKNAYKYTIIRVQFPNDYVLEAIFEVEEKISTLFEFVGQNLAYDFGSFVLFDSNLPSMKFDDFNKTFGDYLLAPTGSLRFEWSEQTLSEFTSMNIPVQYLSQETKHKSLFLS